MEVDHIILRSKGGLDRYDNLQLLHRQCHVNKTARKHLQEPDEGKLSRPDLKTRISINGYLSLTMNLQAQE